MNFHEIFTVVWWTRFWNLAIKIMKLEEQVLFNLLSYLHCRVYYLVLKKRQRWCLFSLKESLFTLLKKENFYKLCVFNVLDLLLCLKWDKWGIFGARSLFLNFFWICSLNVCEILPDGSSFLVGKSDCFQFLGKHLLCPKSTPFNFFLNMLISSFWNITWLFPLMKE